MAVVVRPLSSYFRSCATATINLIGEQFVTHIDTDDGWYVEPPPVSSLMEAVRQIRLWAGERYDVAVIEDLENAELSPVPMSRKEHGRGRKPKIEVQKARLSQIDKSADAKRRIRRCA